jgi:hypothetical protein
MNRRSQKQYQDAIAVLYGIAYGVKMGLKFRETAEEPKGSFRLPHQGARFPLVVYRECTRRISDPGLLRC